MGNFPLVVVEGDGKLQPIYLHRQHPSFNNQQILTTLLNLYSINVHQSNIIILRSKIPCCLLTSAVLQGFFALGYYSKAYTIVFFSIFVELEVDGRVVSCWEWVNARYLVISTIILRTSCYFPPLNLEEFGKFDGFIPFESLEKLFCWINHHSRNKNWFNNLGF